MKKQKIFNNKIYLLFSIIIACIFIIKPNFSTIQNIKVSSPNGQNHTVSNGSIKLDGPEGIYICEIKITNTPFFSGVLQIIPDDCINKILINRKIVELETLFESAYDSRCDLYNGVYLNLNKYLNDGVNTITIEIENHEGGFALNVIDSTVYSKYVFLTILVLVSIYLLLSKKYEPILKKCRYFIPENKIPLYIIIGYLFLCSVAIMIIKSIDSNLLNYCLLVNIILLVLMIVIYRILKVSLFGPYVVIFLVTIIVVCSFYLTFVSYKMYSYDVEGHLIYVKYIVDRNHIPIPSGGWVFYHPSLYYQSAAYFYEVLRFLSSDDFFHATKTLQAYSFCLFLIYIYYGILCIDLFFRQLILKNIFTNKTIKVAYISAAALFIFWPLNPFIAIRIGNDILFYTFFIISFFYSMKWWIFGETKNLVIGLLIASLCIWTKTNGYILYGIYGILILHIHLFSSKDRNLKYPLIFTFLLLFFTTFYFSFGHKLTIGKQKESNNLVVGNAGDLSPALSVESKLSNFFPFSPYKFIKVPFTDSFDDMKGRQNFWFYLFKTSLFGEFPFKLSNLVFIARIMSMLFLLLTITLLFKTFYAFRRSNIPVLINGLLFIIAMIAFRIYYPYSSSNDFRYIYPAILPFSILCNLPIKFYNKILQICTFSIISIFVLTSIIFHCINIIDFIL